jgi:phosphatidate cytidylyltransferase
LTRNTFFRLLVFVVGSPVLALSAFAGRAYGLPVFGAFVVFGSALGAYEAARFFPPETRDYPGRNAVIPLLGAVIPAMGYLSELVYSLAGGSPDWIRSSIVVTVLVVGAASVMAIQVVKRNNEEIHSIVPVVSMHLFLLIYPGLFAWHAIRLVGFVHSSELILIFFLSVYLNDSSAWMFGKLLGRDRSETGKEPIVAVSPHKSAVGFLAGFLASVFVIAIGGRILPQVLPGSLVVHLAFGAIVGGAAILGDLVESGLKRSAEVKDSGQLVPGRGGLLDSIDSPLFAAPFFFYCTVVLYSL